MYRRATIVVSGTFLDNRYTDCIGPLSFLENHPFANQSVFNAAFVSRNVTGKVMPSPAPLKRRWLEKLLMGVAIVRPDSIISLKPPFCEDIHFNLGPNAWSSQTQRFWNTSRRVSVALTKN